MRQKEIVARDYVITPNFIIPGTLVGDNRESLVMYTFPGAKESHSFDLVTVWFYILAI